MSLEDSNHMPPRPRPACFSFQCQIKKDANTEFVYKWVRGVFATPSPPAAVMGGRWGFIANMHHAVVSSYRQSDRDSSAWPVCTELQFPTWRVRLLAKLHCDWVTPRARSKGFRGVLRGGGWIEWAVCVLAFCCCFKSKWLSNTLKMCTLGPYTLKKNQFQSLLCSLIPSRPKNKNKKNSHSD